MCCIRVKPGSVCLQEGSHLVYERTSAAGTDAVHTLFYVPTFKVNNFGILATQFNSDVCLGGIVLQCGGDGNYLLHKRDAQMFGQGEPAGTSYHWRQEHISKNVLRLCQEVRKRFTDIRKMPLIVGKDHFVLFI